MEKQTQSDNISKSKSKPASKINADNMTEKIIADMAAITNMIGMTDMKSAADIKDGADMSDMKNIKDMKNAPDNCDIKNNNQNNNQNNLQCGSLPDGCALMAFPYIAAQKPNPVRYSRMEALETGTLFPGLNLPFKAAMQARTKLSNTALVELMAIDFAIQELGLFLTTHPDDQEALQLYWSYLQLAKEGRERYQRKYGPLTQSDPTPETGFAWLRDPWPWDAAGNP